jgi:hypothetical protein
MRTKLLDKVFANKVYDILVEFGGAIEDERSDFIYHHCDYEYGCMEWRFRGVFGSGGKYRSERNGVSYYPESETPEMVVGKELVERKLKRMKNQLERFAVCFAYFGDGKFLGWYADSFGSVRENSPKVYGYTERQVGVITSNFRSKIAKLADKSDLAKLDGRLGLIDAGMELDKAELSQYENVELKIVVCPEYDGPNPDFDKEAYKKLTNERWKLLVAEGIDDLPAGSERNARVAEFETRHPSPKCDNWTYCDYSKVSEWAKNEPTEFFGTITSK